MEQSCRTFITNEKPQQNVATNEKNYTTSFPAVERIWKIMDANKVIKLSYCYFMLY